MNQKEVPDLPENLVPQGHYRLCIEEFLQMEQLRLQIDQQSPFYDIVTLLVEDGIVDFPETPEDVMHVIHACQNYLADRFPLDEAEGSRPYAHYVESVAALSLDPQHREEYERLRNMLALFLYVPRPNGRGMDPLLLSLAGASAAMSYMNRECQDRGGFLVGKQIGNVQLLRDMVATFPPMARRVDSFMGFLQARDQHVLLNIIQTQIREEMRRRELLGNAPEISQNETSYLSLAQSPEVNPRGAHPSEIGHLLRFMDDPVLVEKLEERYPGIFTGLSVVERLWVLRLLEGAHDDQYEKVQSLFEQFGAERGLLIQVLQLCSQEDSVRIASLFHRLVNHAEIDVLRAFVHQLFELIQLADDVGAAYQSDPVIHGFVQSISFKKGTELLRRLCESDYDSVVLELGEFQAGIIRTGALLKTIVKLKGKVAPELLAQIQSADVKTHTVIPTEPLFDETVPGNFPSPDVFGPQDHAMVIRNLRVAYGESQDRQDSDLGWLGYLERQLDRDLQDPRVRWILLRDRQDRLIGVCKYKSLGKTEDGRMRFYWGTLYVEPEFQKDYSIGTYLQDLAFEYMRQDAENAGCSDFQVEGAVAPFNVHGLARHVTGFDAVLDGVITEGDEAGKSKPLFRIVWRPKGAFESKDKARWTPGKICAEARTHIPFEGEGIKPLGEHMMIGQYDFSVPSCDFLATFDALSRDRYVVTQFVLDPEQNKVHVLLEQAMAA